MHDDLEVPRDSYRGIFLTAALSNVLGMISQLPLLFVAADADAVLHYLAPRA